MDSVNPRISRLLALAQAKNAAKTKAPQAAKIALPNADVMTATPDTMSATTSPTLKPALSAHNALATPRTADVLSPPTTPPGLSDDEEGPVFKLDPKAMFKSQSEIEYVCGFPAF